jgi:hypothetical protein
MTGKRARRADAAFGADLTLAGAGEFRPAARAEQPHSDSKRLGSGRRGSKRSQAGTDQPAEAQATPIAGDTDAEQAPLAETSVAAFTLPEDAVVRRTKDGWRVGGAELPDLTCAMVLADIIAAEAGMPDARPDKPGADLSGEAGRLRTTVGQLEHALLTRIRVEQAIGVLAERHRIKPRQAFEQLREAARSRGRKVIDIAGDVVASATNPLLQLPDELSRPRSGPRRARQSFNAQ